MRLYFDTSALMPYYREEASSSRVQALLQRQHKPVLISHLTQVEFASALARWVRSEELSEQQANRVETAFYEDISEGRFQVLSLTPNHYARAAHWLLTRRTAMRTLDALHLACAAAHETTLVSLDETQCRAAGHFGLNTMGPSL